MRLHRTILAVGFAVAFIASGGVPSYADDRQVDPGDAARVVVKSPPNFAFFKAPPPRGPGSDEGSARWLCESPYAQCMFDFKPVGEQEMIIVEIGRVRRALVENRSKTLAIDEKIAANLWHMRTLQQNGQFEDARSFADVVHQLTTQRDDLAAARRVLLNELEKLMSRVAGMAGTDTLRDRTCFDSYLLCRKAVEASMRLGGLSGSRPPAQ